MGYVTNYLAVQMIFYPVNYIGIPLWVRDGVPLGLVSGEERRERKDGEKDRRRKDGGKRWKQNDSISHDRI